MNVIITAVHGIPVKRIDLVPEPFKFRTPFRCHTLLADDLRQFRDAMRGQSLLGDRVNPKHPRMIRTVLQRMFAGSSARGVIHSGASALPEISVFMTDPAGLITDERKDRFLRQIFQSPEMLLQILLVQQQIPYMIPVAAEQSIAVFRPCEKRRIVKNMDPHLRIFADHFSGPRGRVFRNDPGKRFIPVQNIIEIMQGLHSGKTGLRIFAEQRHETGVPDPDVGIAKRLVHVRSLRHSGQIDQMIVRQLPCFPVQPVQFRLLVINRNRNP